ncbi:apolipoprotein L domain-containing protein 1 [Tiliqua scincoides]|uniref:apolipoprotein L domain-containing protein 1 n=1 Tax=Tiliqua scincoides TaxID=71010 RepID=UPI003462BF8D
MEDIFPHILDPTHHFCEVLKDQRRRLHDNIKNLRDTSRRIHNLHRRTLIANLTGSSLSAAGAITAIVGLTLSPATFGASLFASGVGLGVAAAGGAVTVTSDLSLVVTSSKLVRRLNEIVVTCQNQMREIKDSLEFLRQKQSPNAPTLLPAEKNVAMLLYNSVTLMVFCGSQGFLVPEHAREMTKASHAVLRAKVRKMLENMEACARPMDEICELLENREEFPMKTKPLEPWEVRIALEERGLTC